VLEAIWMEKMWNGMKTTIKGEILTILKQKKEEEEEIKTQNTIMHLQIK